jgi:hypothetical protein
VISGGGGAHLERQKFGEFHHALVIRVGKGTISERILHVREKTSLEDGIEYLAFSEVFPWLRDHWPLAIILNLGFVGIFFWAFHGLFRVLSVPCYDNLDGIPKEGDASWGRMTGRLRSADGL